jgi:hypothetical protein
MTPQTGWVKMHRRLKEWEWYKDSHMVHLFNHILLTANHEPGRWQGVDVNIGELVVGRKTLSEETGISEQSVRTCLKRLKSTGEVTIKSTNKFSLITVVNWDYYQGNGEESTSISTSNLTNNQPATNQQLTTNKKERRKEGKEGKRKKEEPPKPPVGGIPLPPDIDPETWKAFVEMRKKIKAPLTNAAMKLTFDELDRIRGQTGQDKNDVLEQSVQKSWRGVFAIKDDKTVSDKGVYYS